MGKRAILIIFIILVISPLVLYVNAAGGGGGDSGGGSGNGGSGGSVPVFSAITCFDDGHIEFKMKNPQDSLVAINEETNETINFSGKWTLTNFKSYEAIFVDAGNYSVTWGSTKNKFSCPGLKLACSLVQINNIYCVENSKGLSAGFELIHETDVKNLKYNFATEDKTLSYSNTQFNSLLANLEIKKEGEAISLTLNESLGIKEFEVIHNTCIGKRYIYSRVDCTGSSQQTKQIDPEELKCGGLLELEDRVRCRINLESEQEEYQNFFPEECRNREDSEKCHQLYRSVSECWDLSPSEKRINCLKAKINLNDIKKERESCSNINCKIELNEKLKTMIKLRFYNLEEQAEILEEKGLLQEDDLVEFVTEIERKKSEFNDADTKEEMRNIIQDVQSLWKDLMIKLKPIK